MVKIGQ